METGQIRKRIEELSTREIQENISEGYYNDIETKIARDIINQRIENRDEIKDKKYIKLTKRAVNAAWIAALAAIASAIFALLTYLKS